METRGQLHACTVSSQSKSTFYTHLIVEQVDSRSMWTLWRRENTHVPVGNRIEIQLLGRPTRSLVTIPAELFRLLFLRWASPYEILMHVVSSRGVSRILRPVGLQSDTTLGHLSSPVLFTCLVEWMIQELLLVLGLNLLCLKNSS
jgi:hypothetical protein